MILSFISRWLIEQSKYKVYKNWKHWYCKDHAQGGVIWSKTFYWKKYEVKEKTTIGYFPKVLTEEELKSKYPNYIDFEFIKTEYGTYQVLATPIEYVEVVKSNNKDQYPINGIKDKFWYGLIK